MMSLFVQKNKSPRIIECPIYSLCKTTLSKHKGHVPMAMGSAYGNAHTLDFKITEIIVVDFIWFY